MFHVSLLLTKAILNTMENAQTVAETVAFYIEAWNQATPGAIRNNIEKCWAPNCTYTDKNTPLINGIDEIINLIIQSLEKLPVRTFILPAPPEYFDNCGRYRWTLQKPGGGYDGMDYFEFNDENFITRIVGFVNPLA